MENNNYEQERTNFLNQAENLLQRNLLSEALILAEERLRSSPFDVDAYLIASNVFISMGRIAEAQDILRKVEETISRLSLIYIEMGDIYQQKCFYKDAAICYQKFIAMDPTSEKAKIIAEKVSFLEQEESPVTEVSEISEIDDVNITKPEFYTVTLAELYIKQGHLKMAADILEEIIKKEPQNIQAITKLGIVKAAITSKSSANAQLAESNYLVNVLSSWLENIDRLKMNAADK